MCSVKGRVVRISRVLVVYMVYVGRNVSSVCVIRLKMMIGLMFSIRRLNGVFVCDVV